ncbi:MAG: hypothetical protein J7L71_06435 [Spirochaetaceae bacterium]|nr:hypothetical protein [Spirochaetaceae bacterium]
MKKVFGFSILILFFLLTYINADTGIKIVDTVFLPKEYFVGDKVELRIKLNIEDGFSLQLPAKIPESSWVNINSVDISGSEKVPELKILFTPFIPGTRSLPTLSFGEIIINSVKIHTSSLIDSRDSEFVGIMNQALLPGTKFGLILLIGILFFSPIFFILLLGPLRSKIFYIIKKNIGLRPFRKLNRNLKDLEIQKSGISCRRFYIRLSGSIREYLSKRTDTDFITLTTSDMKNSFVKILGNRELSEELYKMMRLSDKIKFGNVTTTDEQKMIDIELIKKVSEFLELELKNKDITRSTD